MKIHTNDFLFHLDGSKDCELSLVLLNSESVSIEIAKSLWGRWKYVACADGGANRLYDGLEEEDRQQYIPNYITGDLDSLRDQVAHFYRRLGTEIILDGDQDSNDLDKSLALLERNISKCSANKSCTDHDVIILGGFGGRFDQEIASLNSLYRWKGVFRRLLLVDNKSTTVLLESGVQHAIRPIRNSSIYEGKYCGLLPLANKVEDLYTTGLEWNLSHESLQFGVRVSTSNCIPENSHEVTVITSHDILWTCTYDRL